MTTLTLFQQQTPTKTPTIKLRDDQKALKKELYDTLRSGYKRVLLVAPCGWGKTVFLCQIIYDAALKRQRRTLIIVPFTVLIEQTLETLEKFGLTAGVIAGEYKEDRTQTVQIATTQTLARRDISWFNPEVILADEVHLSGYCQWFRNNFNNLKDGRQTTSIADISQELAVLGIAVERESLELDYKVTIEEAKEKYKNLTLIHHPDMGGSKEKMQELNAAWEIIKKQEHLFSGKTLSTDNRIVIGLTATPWRLSKKEELGDIFEVQVTGPTPSEMVKNKALVGCIYFASKEQINVKGIKTSGGDFDANELETRCLEAVKSIVLEYKRLGQDRPFVCFAAGKKHAESLVKEFNEKGISTAIITAETPTEERQEIFKKVARLQLRGIVNINTCGIGFNLPAISCIIHSRPTKSLTLYIQMTGRGQRLCTWLDKTDCIVLDQAGNVKRHGFIEDVQYPQLRKNRASDTEKGEAPVKECENCGCIVHASARICPNCGHEFTSEGKAKRIANEKLQLMVPDADKKIYYAYRHALREAYQKGQKPEVTRYQMVQLFKKELGANWWPKNFWKLHAVFGEEYTKEDVKRYEDYLIRCCRGIENKRWVDSHMKQEFGDDWKDTRE